MGPRMAPSTVLQWAPKMRSTRPSKVIAFLSWSKTKMQTFSKVVPLPLLSITTLEMGPCVFCGNKYLLPLEPGTPSSTCTAQFMWVVHTKYIYTAGWAWGLKPPHLRDLHHYTRFVNLRPFLPSLGWCRYALSHKPGPVMPSSVC